MRLLFARFGISIFALAGTLALAACAAGGGPGIPIPAPDGVPAVYRATQGVQAPALFVASDSPYFVDGYTLPLHTGERASMMLRGINEPVPVAADSRSLYIGSFDDGSIYTYGLPLEMTWQVPARSPGLATGLRDLSGLAVAGQYLFAAGEGPNGEEVLEYRLPLVAGEKATSFVRGFPVLDFLAVGAERGTLYIASAADGTVGAYRLPLRNGETPEYTIDTPPQIDGAVGVAIDRRNAHLYVSLYRIGDVYRYNLPYRAGEKPVILDVRAQTGGELPYGIAVGANHLYVTAGAILAYSLPISARSTPDATVSFAGGNAAGLAVSR